MALPPNASPAQANALQRILAGLPGLGMKAAVSGGGLPTPTGTPSPRPLVVQNNPADQSLAKVLASGAYSDQPIETGMELTGRLAQAFAGQKLERDYQDREANKYSELTKVLAGVTEPGKIADILVSSGDPGLIKAGIEYRMNPPKAATDAFDVVKGDDGKFYRINKRSGEVADTGIGGPAPGFVPLVTPEERAAAGIPETDKAPYQKDSKSGRVYPLGSSGTSVTVNNSPEGTNAPLDKKLSEEEGKDWAEIKKEGIKAAGLSQDMGALDELLKVAPQGPITGRLAQMFPGFSTAGDAAMSIMMRVAPSLRTPGSGATSDIEYEGFLRSIPRLQNSPQANAIISSVIKAKAALNVERGEVISRYQDRSISIEEARRQLNEINKRSVITPEIRSLIPVESNDAPKPAEGGKAKTFEFNGKPVTIERID